jgi:hypothetical protein
MSLQFFVRDFMRMKDGQEPEERVLAAELHELQIAYIFPIHFANDMEEVVSFPDPTAVTLRQILEQKLEIASAASAGTVCSSHDLQPIFRRFFQLPHRFWDFKERYKVFEHGWEKERKRAK